MNEQPDVEVPRAPISNGFVTLMVPVVDNLPTLPYASLWEAWAEHTEHCSQCAFVLHETEEQDRDALCWEGQTLNIGISKKITHTAEMAALS